MLLFAARIQALRRPPAGVMVMGPRDVWKPFEEASTRTYIVLALVSAWSDSGCIAVRRYIFHRRYLLPRS